MPPRHENYAVGSAFVFPIGSMPVFPIGSTPSHLGGHAGTAQFSGLFKQGGSGPSAVIDIPSNHAQC
jgi:hypothetical protein